MPQLTFNNYKSLDDIMHAVFTELLNRPFENQNKRGKSSEIIGISFTLIDPRARLSRSEIKSKAYSALGELLWYLAGSNNLKFIEHYIPIYKDDSDDGETLYGAYGPRLFNMRSKVDQIKNIIALLTKNPLTRKAVIQLFDAEDLIGEHKEIPCTCTIQFLIREEKLNMYVSMRSNDAYKGLPHDIFAFTMIQEIMARSLGKELGKYHHSVGSLHLYDYNIDQAKKYINEGFQEWDLNMAPMPIGDPWSSMNQLLIYEKAIREGQMTDLSNSGLDGYWENLAKLLLIYKLSNTPNTETKIEDLMNSMDQNFKVYITPRIKKVKKLNIKNGE